MFALRLAAVAPHLAASQGRFGLSFEAQLAFFGRFVVDSCYDRASVPYGRSFVPKWQGY